MDCASNYTALIQLGVTFSFVFVVLREGSVNLAGDVISTIFKKMRDNTMKEGDHFLSFIPNYSLELCAQDKRKHISRDLNEVTASFDSFMKLVNWKPKFMSPWCLICGLYSLVLLFLYAELNENVRFQVFFQVFVILSTVFNLFYIRLEFKQFNKRVTSELNQQFYTGHLFLFILIVIVSFISLMIFEKPCSFISDKFFLYWSIFLSFVPFIVVGLLAFCFFVVGKAREHTLCNKIEDLNIDYNNAVDEAKRSQKFGFGEPSDTEGLGFKKVD